MNEKMSKLTSKWWRNKIECCHHDNGDSSTECMMAGVLADLLARQNAPSQFQLDKFEEVLTKTIMNNTSVVVTLNCDYHPCEILHDAASAAGIDESVFPWKVSTQTTEDSVCVKDGYGSPMMEIDESYFQEEDI